MESDDVIAYPDWLFAVGWFIKDLERLHSKGHLPPTFVTSKHHCRTISRMDLGSDDMDFSLLDFIYIRMQLADGLFYG